MTFKTIIKLAEPKTLTASVLPVLLAASYAYSTYQQFDSFKLLWLIIGMVLVQSATNMINDYHDFKREADAKDKADEKALASGEITLIQLKRLITGIIIAALAIGVYFSATNSWWILLVMLIAMGVSYGYSAGPMPLCYTPFGELAAGVTMGFGITTTSIYILSGVFNGRTVLMALPTAMFIGALLLANNLSDAEADRKAGRKTSVILLGVERANQLWLGLTAGMYVVCLILAALNVLSFRMLIGLIIFMPVRQIYYFYTLEKKRMHKGQLMGTTSKIGLVYHLSAILSILVLK